MLAVASGVHLLNHSPPHCLYHTADQPAPAEKPRVLWKDVPLHPNGNVLNRLADSRPRDLTQMDGMHTIGGLMKDSIRSMTTYPGRMTAELIAYDARDLSQTRPWVAGMYHAVQCQYMPSILQAFLSNTHSGSRQTSS